MNAFDPQNGPESTAVIIATRGRPTIVRELVDRLADQTLPPDHVFVIGTGPGDVAGLADQPGRMTVHIGRAGLALQRNDGLALAGSRFSYIVFFDDDFVPSRFWIERMTQVFRATPAISGLTGIILADGASTEGISFQDAQEIVAKQDEGPSADDRLHEEVGYGGNVGCNMAFRASAIGGLAFDERLPAYAWLEDADFRGQVLRSGRFGRSEGLWGVHMGHKAGRSRGVPLGYSQIANAVYLARKRTVPRAYLTRLAMRNVASNLARSLRPEPHVDRRGRLIGNLVAVADLLRGRLAPERATGL